MELALINYFYMLSIPDTKVDDFSATFTEDHCFAIKKNDRDFAKYYPGAGEIYFQKGWKSRIFLQEIGHLNHHARKNINLTPESLKAFIKFLSNLYIEKGHYQKLQIMLHGHYL